MVIEWHLYNIMSKVIKQRVSNWVVHEWHMMVNIDLHKDNMRNYEMYHIGNFYILFAV